MRTKDEIIEVYDSMLNALAEKHRGADNAVVPALFLAVNTLVEVLLDIRGILAARPRR